jgi:hypothetical protein
MTRDISPGSTNISSTVRFLDSGAGTPEEGVTKDTAGLALWYRREAATKTAITPSDLTTLADAHSDGGMLHVDDGYYRIDVPDAAFASGSDGVMIGGTATGMIVIGAYHPLAPSAGEDAYTGTLTIDDGSTGLQGAVVNARRGGVLKASGTTDANGQITNWVFGAYTYDLAVRISGYQPKTDTITVSADAWTKTISLTKIRITAPSDPTLCTVQFRVKLSATAVSGAVCKAKLNGVNHASDGTVLSNQELSATTDAQEGMAELELVRKDSLTKGNGLYDIWVEIDGNPVASVKTMIPNQSTILFEDLLR